MILIAFADGIVINSISFNIYFLTISDVRTYQIIKNVYFFRHFYYILYRNFNRNIEKTYNLKIE